MFTDCIVPKENSGWAREGKGFKIAMQTPGRRPHRHRGPGSGHCRGAMGEAAAYTKGRVQFGKPISKFQNTQFTFADMAMRSEAGRLLTYQAAVLKGEGKRSTT
ncbi:MAG: acyl-CoA dehydrogenase family protein [Oscillibacter sp.]